MTHDKTGGSWHRKVLPYYFLAVVVALSRLSDVQAQSAKPGPTLANVSYGPHERNVLDFWNAESEQPTPVVIFIHGGGFAVGSKEGIQPGTLKRLLDSGISVVAVNYRYYQQAALPAALHDCRRALQFVRAHAEEWNIDRSRIGAFGSSAGAVACMYLAFHDEMANSESADPVERESTRLTCVATTAGQTTLDTAWWVANIPGWSGNQGKTGDNHADGRWGCSWEDFPELIQEASALNLISQDDPPIWMRYNMSPEDQPPADRNEARSWKVHHVAFGLALKSKMDELGLESHLRYPGSDKEKSDTLEMFLVDKLRNSGSVHSR
ncbi:alpha/beta hydrolase fold domain-containing protein [Planctomicrobium sp. SH664]|uniref:alpha/beta hydrolase fold domain-containing protein n=1 Tax=Planctomicrobium sp. SH664 TaxID=3448125 RepID=UPI003F5BC39F